MKAVVFVALVAAAVTANAVFGISERFDASGITTQLQSLMHENLALALLLYVAVTVVGSVVVALPGIVFAVVAGVCFGPALGTLACVAASTLGAVLAFVAARYFLRDWIRPRAMRNELLAKWLFDETQVNTVMLLAITRLVPLFPYNLQNFAYGVTGISLPVYAACSFVFMIPGCALYTVLAAGVVDANLRVLCFAVAGVLLVMVLAVGWALKRKYIGSSAHEVSASANADAAHEGSLATASAAPSPARDDGIRHRQADSSEGQSASANADADTRCTHCSACRDGCAFLQAHNIVAGDTARMRELAFHCFLCGRCSRICPEGIDGAALARMARREQVAANAGTPPEGGYWLVSTEKAHYPFHNYRHAGSLAFFPGCNLVGAFPQTTRATAALLHERLGAGVIYDCCGKPLSDIGCTQKAQKVREGLARRLQKAGIKTLAVACANCYYELKGTIPQRVVSVYELLAQAGIAAHCDFGCSSMRVFPPCPDRATGEVFATLQTFLPESGWRLCADAPDEPQCCGLGGCAGIREPQLAQHMAHAAGSCSADAALWVYCASCAQNIARADATPPQHVLSALVGVHELPETQRAILNRAKARFW